MNHRSIKRIIQLGSRYHHNFIEKKIKLIRTTLYETHHWKNVQSVNIVIPVRLCHAQSAHQTDQETGYHGWGPGADRNKWRQRGLIGLSVFVGTAAAVGYWKKVLSAQPVLKAASVESTSVDILKQYGIPKPGLPEYSLDEIAPHNNVGDRVWMCFNSGVYDITDFIAHHPGGDNIMLGAGGSVEPFWALYAVHKQPHVLEILEKYRIGNLRPSEVHQATADMTNPFANEPRRHVALKPSSVTPFNAEPPPPLLVESLLTPNDLFYIRNHLPVPDVSETEYELEVEVEGLPGLNLTLQQLKAFPKYTITAAIQCGGNRRSEMVKVRPVKGLNWSHAAIGNATWSGARLCDVLRAAGYKEGSSAKHVQFEGLDLDPTSHPYGASIPLWKAVDPAGEVLLAYEMNGAPLSRDHGYPVRAVVPGVVGARNVKWLARIVVSEEESQSHWQQSDYKGFAPNVDWDTVDFSKSPAIQEMPVVSAICSPSDGDTVTVKDGKVAVRGYAYSGGGRRIIRVDVSGDGGTTWRAAESLESDEAEHPRAWGWTLWRADVPVPKGAQQLQLVAKAIDSNYNTQPENFENIWTLRGVLSNAYHRITVKMQGKAK